METEQIQREAQEVRRIIMDDYSRRGWRPQLRAVAPMAVMILIVAACGSSDDDASTGTTAPPAAPTTTTATTSATSAAPTTTARPVTTQPPTTTTAREFTVDEALAVSDAYFAAYEAGDVDAMLALFTPDLDLLMSTGSRSLERWEQLYTWKSAEGTILTPSECDATTVEDTGITVVCEYAHHQYPAILVGAPATAHTLTMTVTPNGSISSLRDRFHSPAWVTDDPLASWVRRNHPGESGKVNCCFWASVEDARAKGLIRAQYAEEWATYLEANGCAYTDGC